MRPSSADHRTVSSNPCGARQEVPSFAYPFPDGTSSGRTSIFEGEDADAGLLAIADVDYRPAGDF